MIDVARAIELYGRLNSWRLVAAEMVRPDGGRFQWQSICVAVNRYDMLMSSMALQPWRLWIRGRTGPEKGGWLACSTARQLSDRRCPDRSIELALVHRDTGERWLRVNGEWSRDAEEHTTR